MARNAVLYPKMASSPRPQAPAFSAPLSASIGTPGAVSVIVRRRAVAAIAALSALSDTCHFNKTPKGGAVRFLIGVLLRAVERKQDRETAKLAMASPKAQARARAMDRLVYAIGIGMLAFAVLAILSEVVFG